MSNVVNNQDKLLIKLFKWLLLYLLSNVCFLYISNTSYKV